MTDTYKLGKMPQTLRDLRIAQGLTQKDIAEAMGISQSQVSKIEYFNAIRVTGRCMEAITGSIRVNAPFRVSCGSAVFSWPSGNQRPISIDDILEATEILKSRKNGSRDV